MARLTRSGLCKALLWLAVAPFARPMQPIDRRDHTYLTSTVWIEPYTKTVNPLDPTITRPAGYTNTVWPPNPIRTITTNCITYDFIFPPPYHDSHTVTASYRNGTVTVTDTNRPLQTQYSWHTPEVTVTTPRGTGVALHCLNTLIVNYHDYPDATYTYTYYEHVTAVTGLCLTSTTRSTTIPGVVLPTRTLDDWEYLTATSSTTKHSIAVVSLTNTVLSGTSTSTICAGNPSPRVTTTYTVTRQPATVTVYSLLTVATEDCYRSQSRSTIASTATNSSPSATAAAVSEGVGMGMGVGVGVGVGDRRLEGRQLLPPPVPIEVQTVVYTTVTVIDNVVRTLTGTAVVDVFTQTFARTVWEYVTTTGTGVATSTSWVCEMPGATSIASVGK